MKDKNKQNTLEIQLNTRYKAMLNAFADGTPDKAIAFNLNIALSTLDFHKRNLFQILNANSKPHAVSIAYKKNILCVN